MRISEEEKNKIIEDICALHKDLASQREELRELLDALLLLRPRAEISDRFRAELRDSLVARARELSLRERETHHRFALPRFNYLLAGALASLVLLVGAVYLWGGEALLPGKPSVVAVHEKMFGDLSSREEGVPAGEVLGFGGAGGSPAISAPSGLFVAPSYRFEYRGVPISVPQSVRVLRRIKGDYASKAFADRLRKTELGIFDLSRLGNPLLQSFSLIEDRPYGYEIHVNLAEGNITINQSWVSWQGEEEQVGMPNAIPEDGVLIGVADGFLAVYGIDRDIYDTPLVSHDWRVFQNDPDFMPDALRVSYPAMITDNPVFESSGEQAGLSVLIRLRDLRVLSLWGLAAQSYEGSLYPAERDTDRLISIAEQGGWFSAFPTGLPSQRSDASSVLYLDTPFRGYVKSMRDREGTMEELLVPSFIFPVQGEEDGSHLSRVIVPLPREVLDSSWDR